MKNLSRPRKTIPSFQLDGKKNFAPIIFSLYWITTCYSLARKWPSGLVRSLSYTRLQERRGGGNRYREFFNPRLRSKLKLNGASDRPPPLETLFARFSVRGVRERKLRNSVVQLERRPSRRIIRDRGFSFGEARKLAIRVEELEARTSVCSKTLFPERFFFFENIKFRLNLSSKISNEVTWSDRLLK